jgi:hypothetical protein
MRALSVAENLDLKYTSFHSDPPGLAKKMSRVVHTLQFALAVFDPLGQVDLSLIRFPSVTAQLSPQDGHTIFNFKRGICGKFGEPLTVPLEIG